MGTTDLFVELIVIGIGAFIWMIIAALCIFGYTWVPLDQLFSVPALIPFLSFIYIAGIITDRIADGVLGAIWKRRILRKHYASSEVEIDDRILIYSKSEYLGNLIEYGRSRLRICRGWAFNGVLIMVACNVFIVTQVPDANLKIKLFVWLNLLVGFLAYFSWYSWYQLTDTQYRRVKGEADFIRRQDRAEKGNRKLK